MAPSTVRLLDQLSRMIHDGAKVQIEAYQVAEGPTEIKVSILGRAPVDLLLELEHGPAEELGTEPIAVAQFLNRWVMPWHRAEAAGALAALLVAARQVVAPDPSPATLGELFDRALAAQTRAPRDRVLHQVKAWPEFYGPLAAGRKPFEIRENDRDYRAGDGLEVREFDRAAGVYTGARVLREVTYATEFQQRPGWIVLGLAEPTIYPCGCSRHKVAAGRCDTWGAGALGREAGAV
jgi:hypothetical protein